MKRPVYNTDRKNGYIQLNQKTNQWDYIQENLELPSYVCKELHKKVAIDIESLKFWTNQTKPKKEENNRYLAKRNEYE